MGQQESHFPVKDLHGAVTKDGPVNRKKVFRDANGNIIAYGPQEIYGRPRLRDLKKNPLSENEIRQRSLWQAACNQTKAELDNPTTRASWQARFNEQLQHATADTPAKLVKGQRIIYKRFDAFVRAVIYNQLRTKI